MCSRPQSSTPEHSTTARRLTNGTLGWSHVGPVEMLVLLSSGRDGMVGHPVSKKNIRKAILENRSRGGEPASTLGVRSVRYKCVHLYPRVLFLTTGNRAWVSRPFVFAICDIVSSIVPRRLGGKEESPESRGAAYSRNTRSVHNTEGLTWLEENVNFVVTCTVPTLRIARNAVSQASSD